MILLPAAAYIILHVLGYRYPARLWGVDQFHYYSPALLAAFVAAACGAWILAARYAQPSTSCWRVFWSAATAGLPAPAAPASLLLCFLAAACTLRVPGRYLGDSSMWFANMEMLLKGRAEPPP